MARTRRTTVAAVVLAAVATGCAPDDPASPPTAPEAEAVATDAVPPRADPAEPDRGDRGPADAPPRWARTPRQLAVQVLAAERAIDDVRTSPTALAAAGRQQQLAYRVLGTRPGWDARVRALLPRWVRPSVAANVASRREFRSMHGELSRTLPAWRIVRPAPPPVLMRHYRKAERRFGVAWEHLAAINLVETGMGRIRGLSVAGAQGPMQFMPATWAAYGRGDVDDPRDAIMAAGRYLDAMGYRRGSQAAVEQALYRYNNHPAYVRGVDLLAAEMQRRPRAYLAYHAWEIYYLTARGDVRLPVGYAEREPVPVGEYLRR